MTIYDLIFLLNIFATFCMLLVICAALLRRKPRLAGRAGLFALALWAAYLAAGTVVAVATPQTVLTLKDARCFDEICFLVTEVHRTGTLHATSASVRANGVFYIVTVQTFSQSRGRPQREAGAVASLLDADRRRYQPLSGPELWRQQPPGFAPSLDSLINPGETVSTRLVFDVPTTVHNPGLVISHSYRLNPALIILGDQQHFLHRPTVIQLPE